MSLAKICGELRTVETFANNAIIDSKCSVRAISQRPGQGTGREVVEGLRVLDFFDVAKVCSWISSILRISLNFR